MDEALKGHQKGRGKPFYFLEYGLWSGLWITNKGSFSLHIQVNHLNDLDLVIKNISICTMMKLLLHSHLLLPKDRTQLWYSEVMNEVCGGVYLQCKVLTMVLVFICLHITITTSNLRNRQRYWRYILPTDKQKSGRIKNADKVYVLKELSTVGDLL